SRWWASRASPTTPPRCSPTPTARPTPSPAPGTTPTPTPSDPTSVFMCGIAQYGNLWGTMVGYTITATISMV
uniref:Amino acid transporter transmembrane domain-containing protein n=1 Tax=Aegilops tauschii subsp. strangulata TaxID=200361 RepID=A0A453G2U3_AEGTS